jgi:hypothetical protein
MKGRKAGNGSFHFKCQREGGNKAPENGGARVKAGGIIAIKAVGKKSFPQAGEK